MKPLATGTDPIFAGGYPATFDMDPEELAGEIGTLPQEAVQDFVRYLALAFEHEQLRSYHDWRERVSLSPATRSGKVADLETEPGRVTLLSEMVYCAPEYDDASDTGHRFLAVISEILLHEIEEYEALTRHGQAAIEEALRNEMALQIAHSVAVEKSRNRFLGADPAVLRLFWEGLHYMEPFGFQLDADYQELLETITSEKGLLEEEPAIPQATIVTEDAPAARKSGAGDTIRIARAESPEENKPYRIAQMAVQQIDPLPDSQFELLCTLPDRSSAYQYSDSETPPCLVFVSDRQLSAEELAVCHLYDAIGHGEDSERFGALLSRVSTDKATACTVGIPQGTRRLSGVDFSSWELAHTTAIALTVAKSLKETAERVNACVYTNQHLCRIPEALNTAPDTIQMHPPVLCPYAFPPSMAAAPDVVLWQGFGLIMAHLFGITDSMLDAVRAAAPKSHMRGKKLIIKKSGGAVTGTSRLSEGMPVPAATVNLVHDLLGGKKMPALYERIVLVLKSHFKAKRRVAGKATPRPRPSAKPRKREAIQAYKGPGRVTFDPSIMAD
jgi:hypothetical protein